MTHRRMAACRKEEEKAGMSPTASAAGGGGTAEASAAAALNVPTYLPAANMLLGKTLRQFLDRGAREAGAAVTQQRRGCHMCSRDSVIDRISPVGQS